MEREQWDRLLAEYSTGGLSEEDKKKLFTAALADQALFDELAEDDALRESIEMPGARKRLIDSLSPQEESVLSMPSPVAARKPMWLAWAAGIGIVFVSGAITYVMFETPVSKDIASVRPSAPQTTKPFVPPPPRVEQFRKMSVEEPPGIPAETRGPVPMARPVNIPLPSAPPPAEPAPAKDEVMLSARSEFKIRADQQLAPAGGSVVRMEAARESKAKLAIALPSLWRRAGGGVWYRVPAGDAVGRNDFVAVRYVPVAEGSVVLLDAAGRRVASKPGRAGEELELFVPAAILQRADGDLLTLSIVEGSRSTPVKILLRRE